MVGVGEEMAMDCLNKMDAVAESRRKRRNRWKWRISGLTRDGTAEPVSQDQLLSREQGQGKSILIVKRAK